MRNKLQLFILMICVPLAALSQTDYYWYKGNKIPLIEKSNKRFILLKSSEISGFQSGISSTNAKISAIENVGLSSKIIPYSDISSYGNYKWVSIDTDNDLNAVNIIGLSASYVAPYYLTVEGKEVGLSHLFYVKLRSATDITTLTDLAATHHVTILGNNEYMPLWYTLMCDRNSTGNALQMANMFYETNLFSYCEADLMSDDLQCVNDPLFTNQWSLSNTGQHGGVAGFDINYCNARTITQGNNGVIVAVLDQGIELNHPDLNVHPVSFNSETGTSPSLVLGNHGVCCAGIISANSNNNLGIAGISPGCPVMSISNSLASSPDSRQKRADGFNFARLNGASVISNSWSSAVSYAILDDAITNAVTLGRNGKGCVVVFSSGNNNSGVSYPANSNSGILCVGAMSPCGERKNYNSCDQEIWGSNYGPTLDIVAPGVFIPTTDRQGSVGEDPGNYYLRFNGTSSACPHAAGVAALILSVNPDLTQKDVVDIIESTARKIGQYTYSTTAGRPNGSWNNEMGYGLLDAYAAVVKAQSMGCPTIDFSNRIVNTSTTVTGCKIVSQSVTVTNAAKLTLSGREEVTINPPFTVNAGSQLEIKND